jgi:hypothetical protein
MIRFMVVSALVGMLVLVLALPATRPPGHFLALMRAEHAATVDLWGTDAADAILQRVLAMHGDAAAIAPVPSAEDRPVAAAQPSNAASTSATSSAAQQAAAREMAVVSRRLFDNAYFRSVEALMLLATFRLAALLQWLPWLAALGVAVLVDGLTVRRIRALALRSHDPERFAVFAGSAVFGVCLLLLAAAAPMRLPPLASVWMLAGIAALVGLAVGEFHRQSAA